MAPSKPFALSRTLLARGSKSLRNYLQSELQTLKQTPVLLIGSEAGASSAKLKPVADSCRWVKFTLGQEFSMRTVPMTISSAFPTRDSLEQTLELMQRTGASSVVSVGSGAAMDLGKAVRATLDDTSDECAKKTPLILVPTTYGGVLASGASHSLFLDNDEETLVPLPTSHRAILDSSDGACGSSHATISTLEAQTYMEPLDATKFDELIYAVSVILLDAGLRESNHPSLPMLLQNTIDLISLRNNEIDFDSEGIIRQELVSPLNDLLYQSAGLLSYGLSNGFEEEDNRSIPIALGSSLIPTLFPEMHPTSFMASLVPGICHLHSDQQQQQQQQQQSQNNKGNSENLISTTLVDLLKQQFSGRNSMMPPPSLVPRDESLQGFAVPDMALSHIQSNQAVWEPLDFPDDVLVQVLQHCVK